MADKGPNSSFRFIRNQTNSSDQLPSDPEHQASFEKSNFAMTRVGMTVQSKYQVFLTSSSKSLNSGIKATPLWITQNDRDSL